MQINIACLYSDLLNIYGDRGNVIAFTKRCQWRGIVVNTFEIKIGDVIDPEKYDFYFMGGGQDQQQIAVSFELQKQKAALHQAAENGAVFLAICGGYQLLGHYYKPHKEDELKGISLLDIYSVAGHNRFIGNVAIKTDFPMEKANTLTGFENHSGLTCLEAGTVPLGTVITGNGNNGKDKTEGARKRNVFGTYLHGSFLPKNPHFTDYLIKLSLERKYGQVELAEINDDFEWLAHNKAVKRKY